MSHAPESKTRFGRIGLVGEHPWGLGLVLALVSGGAKLCACAGPISLRDRVAQAIPGVEYLPDAAQVISYPGVDLLVLADYLPFRGQLLADATQLDLAVVVVHPASTQPELYYATQLALQERKFAVWPVLPHRFFSGLQKILAWQKTLPEPKSSHLEATVPVNGPLLRDPRLAFTSDSVKGNVPDGHPFWFWADWLRLLGGEVAEIYAVGEPAGSLEEVATLMVTGRWESGGDFVIRFNRGLDEGFSWEIAGTRLEWRGTTIAPGQYCIHWPDDRGSESFCDDGLQVWQRYADWLLHGGDSNSWAASWADAVAVAERVQAAVESLRWRKTVSLLHQEYTEAAVFKSAATTVGCGAIWLILALVMIAPLWPPALYLVPIVLLGCLALFVLGWLAYRRTE